MATPNYGFEKRQKELAKRRKKEEKAKAKADRKTGVGHDQPEDGAAQDGAEDQPAGGAATTDPQAQGGG